MHQSSLAHDQFFSVIESAEPFPVDFDEAWQWLGYTNKRKAKAAFKEGMFTEPEDYMQVQGSERVLLSVDCFKSFAMMAETEKGKEVRRYFLNCGTALASY